MDNEMQFEKPQKPRNSYTATDSVAAIISLVMGYFLVRSMTAVEYPLGRVICSVIIITLSLLYLKAHGQNPVSNPTSVILLVCIVLLSVSRFFGSDEFLTFVCSAALFFAYPYCIFVACGNSCEKYPSSLFFFEELKAVLVLPLGSVPCIFEALMNTDRSKKVGKKILLAVLGIALAFIPAVVVLVLLSYDSAFNRLLDKIFIPDNFNIFSFVGDIILAIPVAVFLFGLLYSSKNKRFSEVLCEKTCRAVTEKVHFAPVVLIVSALTPFIVIYAIFFISQIGYYTSAFGGTLPDGLTYSEYAREGFFELCTVSGINLCLVGAALLFCRRNGGEKSIVLRAYSVIFSFFTLVLIATAMSKMALYISAYGLTVKRVLSSAFMLVLTVIFILILLRQFVKRLPVLPVVLIFAFLLLSVMCFADVDTFIANYNVDRYLSGESQYVDISEFERTSDAHIIALDRLTRNTDDKEIKGSYEKILREVAKERGDNSFFSLTLPKIRAEKILEKYK